MSKNSAPKQVQALRLYHPLPLIAVVIHLVLGTPLFTEDLST